MPHISKEHPAVGHGKKGIESGAVDRDFKNRPRGYAYIGDEEILVGSSSKANICEEAGDCADRVNEEG